MDLASPACTAARDRLIARFGRSVEPWWCALPDLLTELTVRWDLVAEEPMTHGSTSLVIRCRCADASAAVLKLTPDPEIGAAEVHALRAWEPSGRVPAVWGYDERSGSLLLESIGTGVPLRASANAPEVDRIATLLDGLHSVAPTERPTPLAERLRFIFDHWKVAEREPALRLAASAGQQALLHGDLHPGNVLDGGRDRGLVAIDPRPCVGDPAFDAVDWIFWGSGADDRRSRNDDLARRLDLDGDRLWAWCEALKPVLDAAAAASRS